MRAYYIFSRPCFSKGRAIDMVIFRPSVRHECIVAKRCKIGPRLLLITNRKSHIGFQMTWKAFTLNDLEGQYCYRNCIGRSVSSRARRFYCEKYLRNLPPIFSLFIHFEARWPRAWKSSYSSYLYRLTKRPRAMSVIIVFIVAFARQRSVNIACIKLCHLSEIAFSPWLEIGRWASDVGGTVGFS